MQEDINREDKRDAENAGQSKKELRREILPFLICGAVIAVILNRITLTVLGRAIPAGNMLGAALTGLVFGYVAWGFYRFFSRRK